MEQPESMLKKIDALLRRSPFFLPVRQILFSCLKSVKFTLSLFRFKARLNASSKKRFELNYLDLYPCLGDDSPTTSFDPHYLYHLAWAVRKVKEIAPKKHVDFSSHLHFASMLSAFVETEFYDYRPARLNLTNLKTGAADLIKLPFQDNSLSSISCMHVIEHIGLGRYGDPLDPDADLKAVEELKRVVAPGGSLLFVAPVGIPRLMFNGHRIYSLQQVLEMFAGFKVVEKSALPDDWTQGIIREPDQELLDKQNYACGMFWFKKE